MPYRTRFGLRTYLYPTPYTMGGQPSSQKKSGFSSCPAWPLVGYADMGISSPSATISEFPLADLVTIIMPVFNAAAFVDEAIASLVSQTCQDWELLAINDGLHDLLGEIFETWSKQNTHIQILH